MLRRFNKKKGNLFYSLDYIATIFAAVDSKDFHLTLNTIETDVFTLSRLTSISIELF